MLQLKQIHKQYKTGELVQTALDSVSLNLRDNEFVAILGPSGSGKTTLLNIIGGLDRYDQRRPHHQRHLHQGVHGPGLGFLPQPHHRLCVPEL